MGLSGGIHQYHIDLFSFPALLVPQKSGSMVGRHMETSPSKFVTIRLFLGSLDLVSVPCKRKACLMLEMLIYLHLLYPFFDRFPKTYLCKVCTRFYHVHSSTAHLTLTFSGLADI